MFTSVFAQAQDLVIPSNAAKDEVFSLSLSISLCISAGVGRTGCFIVIDAMLERMKHEKSVDIYGHVTCMRAQRNYMVQTEDQYIFIHEALLEAATCGNTEVPARNLYAHIQKLTQPPPGETVTAMELEFKVTARLRPQAASGPDSSSASECLILLLQDVIKCFT